MATIFEMAADQVRDGDVVGLGSGRASTEFIKRLGARVQAGLKMRGVPTSEASAHLATQLRIPLVSLDEGMPLALTVDGADEVDPRLDLIKGYGRALVREKIVAAASRRLVILVGKDKLVGKLGGRGKLPVEVIPLAEPLARRRLKELGVEPVLWGDASGPLKTDNGNYILDCAVSLPGLADAAAFAAAAGAVPGVVGTGLFLGMADVVLVGDQDANFAFVEEKKRPSP
jgi:ribose 5-phosphate isomerase A